MAEIPQLRPIFAEPLGVYAEPDSHTASLHFQQRDGDVVGLIVSEAGLQKLYWHIVHEVLQGRARFDLVRENP